MLQNVGLDAIITSDALRTRETGAIISDALDLQTNALPAGDTAGLVDVLEFEHEEDTVLIVAHAETIPRILKSLGMKENVTIDQSEFANRVAGLGPAAEAPMYSHWRMT